MEGKKEAKSECEKTKRETEREIMWVFEKVNSNGVLRKVSQINKVCADSCLMKKRWKKQKRYSNN